MRKQIVTQKLFVFCVWGESCAAAGAGAGAVSFDERFALCAHTQWALGTKGSGAPVHFHNTAFNQIFYGAKHWYLFPPNRNLMGNRQVSSRSVPSG